MLLVNEDRCPVTRVQTPLNFWGVIRNPQAKMGFRPQIFAGETHFARGPQAPGMQAK